MRNAAHGKLVRKGTILMFRSKASEPIGSAVVNRLLNQDRNRLVEKFQRSFRKPQD
jgi:hypothetical protein